MTNKYLRRLLRSGVFFFIPMGTREAATTLPPAAAKLKCMQGPHNYNWTLQGAPARSVRAPHFSCLLLHASPCLPSSSSTHDSYAYEDALSINEEEGELKQLERSHSCSKLQAGRQLLPSFRSLLHRGASSHHHVDNTSHNHNQSGTPHDFVGEVSSSSSRAGSKYTRSWSSPSLHRRRNIHMTRPQRARSFCSSHSTKDGSRGRCAPKGHVAVYVEGGQERHVVPIAYLSHPLFQALLERAQREYGFRQQGPGLRIPCSFLELHDTLHDIGIWELAPNFTQRKKVQLRA